MRTVARLALGVLPGVLWTSVLAQVPLLPRPEGTHPVGYWRTTHAVNRDRTRPLLLEVWYPATTSPTRAFKPYALPSVSKALATQLDLRAGWDEHVSTHAVEGAGALPGSHPVVLFSHGLSWPMTLYQSLVEDLASRGYVVIGINHPGGAVIDYGGGRVLPFASLPDAASDSARNLALARLTASWADDISAVMAQLPGWANGTATPLAGRLDLARIALMGHSLGASASGLLTSDKRVRAAIALEGMLRDTAQSRLVVGAPFLHLIGGYNRLELENRNYVPSDGAPVYQVIVQGTGHAYFSDLMAIYKSTADSAWLARHRYEVEPLRVIQITRDYAAAFLARYLFGLDSSLLHPVSYAAGVDGPRSAGYPEVEMTIDVK
jgi:alpha-beta hydrolase superfamily lysophospholipase